MPLTTKQALNWRTKYGTAGRHALTDLSGYASGCCVLLSCWQERCSKNFHFTMHVTTCRTYIMPTTMRVTTWKTDQSTNDHACCYNNGVAFVFPLKTRVPSAHGDHVVFNMYIYIDIYREKYIYIYIYTHTCVRIYIYIYIYIYIIHIHIIGSDTIL